MEDIKVGELYKILYCMQSSKSLTEFSNKMFWSSSKSHKKITYYEKKLNKKLYEKSNETLITNEGLKLLKDITPYYLELSNILTKGNDITGYDENLILQVEESVNPKVNFDDTLSLIDDFNIGKYKNIVISEDFEHLIDYKIKEYFTFKDVYLIKSKQRHENKLYANKQGCPITKKLLKNNVVINEHLSQSIGICNVVKSKKGIGYTFSTQTLDEKEIDIVLQEDLKIDFYKYTK